MRTLSLALVAGLVGLVLGGCGSSHHESAGTAASSAVAGPDLPSGGSVVTPGAPGTTVPAPAPSGGAASPGKLPGISITGPTACLTGQQHFDTDQERSTPQVCLHVGAAFDVATMRPERSAVTQVTSSDATVLACGVPRPTVCQAKKAGQSVVTATDGGGVWRVAVFVGR